MGFQSSLQGLGSFKNFFPSTDVLRYSQASLRGWDALKRAPTTTS